MSQKKSPLNDQTDPTRSLSPLTRTIAWTENGGIRPTIDIDPRHEDWDLATNSDEDLSSRGARAIDENPIRVGDVLNGRYQVEAVVGEGGMGRVYRVRDLVRPERPLALKTLAPDFCSRYRLDLFKAEFYHMTRLKHPNVAAVYDFESLQDGSHFFTMEYLEGQDLYRVTEQAGWPRVLELLVQVCRALSYVHNRKMIHYDLKPANVMVTREGRVKVLDFGLAAVILPIRHGQGVIKGTPQYMAPELADLDGRADHRVDLYALGIMAYQLLCRVLPFEGTVGSELLRKHRSVPVTFDLEAGEKIPVWLQSVILRLCAKRPFDRYPTANVVIEAINQGGGFDFPIETPETRESYILSSRFVGREDILRDRALTFVAERTRGREFVPPALLGGPSGRGTSPPALFLAGQSGIGKSRFAREIRHQAQLSRLYFFEGSCYEGASDEYDAIATVLVYLVPLAEACCAPEVLARYGPQLVKVCPSLEATLSCKPGSPAESPQAELLRLWDHVSLFLIDVAQQVPFVLFFDDLQWAREGAIGLLGYLMRLIVMRDAAGEHTPLAILGAYRDDELEGRPLRALLEDLEGRGELDVIALRPLERHQVRVLLGSMLGIEALPDSFVDRMVTETAGNPFFVEEVMRVLVENGSVYLEGGRWAAAADVGRLDIPESITSTFLRRVSFLGADERIVLEVLAISGRPTGLEVLELATGLDGPTLQAALLRLGKGGMTAGVAGEQWQCRIRHDRMREALYGDLEEEARQALHQRVGHALETTYAEDLAPRYHELAYHYRQAGSLEKALSYSLAGGDRARSAYAYDVAIELYQRALDILKEGATVAERRDAGASAGARVVGEQRVGQSEVGPVVGGGPDVPVAQGEPAEGATKVGPVVGGGPVVSPVRTFQLEEKIGDCYALQGRHRDAIHHYRAAMAEARDKLDFARLSGKIGFVHLGRDDLESAIEEMWKTATLLGDRRPRGQWGLGWQIARSVGKHLGHRVFESWVLPLDEGPERRRLAELTQNYLRLSNAYLYCDTLGAFLCVLRGSNLADRLYPAREICRIYGAMTVAYSTLSLFDGALHFGQRALEVANARGSELDRAYVHRDIGMAHSLAGRFPDAVKHLEQARRGFERCSELYGLSTCVFIQAMSHYPMGDLAIAERLLGDVAQLLCRTGERQFYERITGLGLAFIGAEQGTMVLEEAVAGLERAIVLHREAHDLMFLAVSYSMLGEVLLLYGQLEQAIAAFERGTRVREENQLVHEMDVLSYPRLAVAYLERVRLRRRQGQPVRSSEWESARRLVSRSLRLTRWRYPNPRPLALLASGTYEWLSGRKQQARARFQSSRELAYRQGALLGVALTYHEEGRCLLEEAYPDCELGRIYLERAQAIFDRCGARLRAGVVKSLLDGTVRG